MKSLLYNPCPFCGGTSIQPIPRDHGFEVTCTNCSASVYEESEDLIKAATKWNNRVKNITTHDTQEVCDLCCDSVHVNNQYIGEIFQWLIDSDYIIGKRNIKSEDFLVDEHDRGCCDECGEGFDNEEGWKYNTHCEICGHPIPEDKIIKKNTEQ